MKTFWTDYKKIKTVKTFSLHFKNFKMMKIFFIDYNGLSFAIINWV